MKQAGQLEGHCDNPGERMVSVTRVMAVELQKTTTIWASLKAEPTRFADRQNVRWEGNEDPKGDVKV